MARVSTSFPHVLLQADLNGIASFSKKQVWAQPLQFVLLVRNSLEEKINITAFLDVTHILLS
jgi:hypothetical protein